MYKALCLAALATLTTVSSQATTAPYNIKLTTYTDSQCTSVDSSVPSTPIPNGQCITNPTNPGQSFIATCSSNSKTATWSFDGFLSATCGGGALLSYVSQPSGSACVSILTQYVSVDCTGGSSTATASSTAPSAAASVVNTTTAAASTTNTTAPAVNTTVGLLQGTTLNKGTVNAYLGVPYALPPIGSRRFTYAQLANTYNGTIKATQAQSLCPQYNGTGITGSEDCLYLNIYVPTGTPPAGGFPVYVFVPGGGFTATSNISGANLVQNHQNIIQVYVTFRVGLQGYMALPGLSAEGKSRFNVSTSGNYGVHDPIVALQWLQANLKSFGGDASKVTVGGESAGSIQVCYLLASPLTKGLFRGVVMESGGCDFANTDLNTQTNLGQLIATAANCSSSMGDAAQVSCLRNMTSQQLAKAYYAVQQPFSQSNHQFAAILPRPIVDGYVVADYPQNVFKNGSINNVPALFGDCHNEGGLWVAIDPSWQPVSSANPNGATWALPVSYFNNFTGNSTAIAQGLGEEATTNATLKAGSISGAYNLLASVYGPNGTFESMYGNTVGPTAAMDNIITSNIFTCPTRRTARALNNAGNNSWAFDFAYFPSSSPTASLGAIHGSDLPFFFGLENSTDPQALNLSSTIQQYLVNFVVNGNPNTPAGNSTVNLPQWPKYNATSGLYLQFGNTSGSNINIQTVVEPFGQVCDIVWDQLVPILNFSSSNSTTNKTLSSMLKL